MPSPEQILAGLTRIANGWFGLAVAWHVALAAALGALAAGVRPSRRAAALLLCLPMASVSALAWTSGNPFNGTTFAAFALALGLLSLALPKGPVRRGPAWTTAAGALMVGFGWLYPHFLEGRSALAYLYGAPLGLVPCPTLSAVIGLALLGGGVGGRAWPSVLAGAGLFYGLFGTLRLGVTLDWGLVAGALALGAAALGANQKPPCRRP